VDEATGNVMGKTALTGDSFAKVVESDYHADLQAQINKGYNLVSNGAVQAKFDSDKGVDQVFTVTLKKVAAVPLTTTVTPVDENGVVIPNGPTKDITNVPGTKIPDGDTPSVPGYTLVPGQDIKVPTAPGVTNVKYTIDTQKATIEYVDENGVQLGRTEVTGNSNTLIVETDYHNDLQAQINKGYNLVSNGAIQAKFDQDKTQDQVFTVVLKKVVGIAVPTPIVPTDPTGKPIPNVPPTNHTGVPGTPIAVTDMPKVDGFTPTPGQHVVVPTPTVDENGHVVTPPITVIYTANTQKAIIHFVDQAGKPLLPDLILTGPSLSALPENGIMTSIQTILNQGYTLTRNETVGATFDARDQVEQNFTVSFNKVVKNTVTVPFVPVDKDGTPIPGVPSVTITGVPGTDVPTGELPVIPGYTLVPGQTPRIPTAGGAITLVYTPNTTPMNHVNTGTRTGLPNTAGATTAGATTAGNKLAETGGSATSAASRKRLPNTGEQETRQVSVLGAIAIGLSGLVGLVKRKKSDEQ
jgi:LPXTG-motif cell wall-anchored protein